MSLNTEEKQAIVKLFIISLVSHFILIFNTGLYQDDVIVQHFIKYDLNSLTEWFIESSYHFGALMHYLLAQLPLPITAHRVLSFLSITGIGISLFLIFNRCYNFSKNLSFYIAALSMVFSSYKILISIIHTHHILCLFLFYFSWLLYLQRKNKFLQFISYLGMIISFSYNSILVLHYGLLFFTFIITQRSDLKSYLRHNILLFVIPVIFFLLRKSLLSPVGRMAGYNQFANSPKTILYNLYLHFEQIIIQSNINAVKVFFSHPLPICILVISMYIFIKNKGFIVNFETLSSRKILFYLLLFFFACAGPYALVGKGATLYSWSERQALLMGLPLSFSVILISTLFYKVFKSSLVSNLIIFTLLTGHSLKSVQEYLYLEAQAAKSDSIVYNLTKITPPPKGVAIFFTDFDTYKIDHYHWYEINKFMSDAWGSESWIAIRRYPNTNLEFEYKFKLLDEKDIDYKSYKKLFIARDFVPNKCYANLEIHSKNHASLATFGFYYFWSRIFSRTKISDILSKTTDLKLEETVCLQKN